MAPSRQCGYITEQKPKCLAEAFGEARDHGFNNRLVGNDLQMTKLGDLKNARWSIPRGWDIRETHAGDIAVGYLSADDVVRAYIPSNRQRLLVPRTAALILAGSMASSEQDWHWSLAEIDGRWVATATHLNFKVAQVVTGARWGGGTTVQIVVAPPWSLSQHIAVLEGLAWTRDEAKQREARERGDATGGSSRR